MKIVYLTNILNHYQAALGREFAKLDNITFKFISTVNLSEERKKLGIPDYNHSYSWCICAMDSEDQKNIASREFLDADVAIVGTVKPEYKKLVKKRMTEGKITFFAQERLYKVEPKKWEMPLRWLLYRFRHSRFKNKYILCASAFTSFDYSRTFNFRKKCFKWGYFPEFIENSKPKNNDVFKIVWAARYLDWKHPEAMVYLAKYLKEKKYNFEINMIGTGKIFEAIKEKVFKENLTDVINLHGSMSPEGVRKIMDESHVFAFSSDRGEGWGVVLNEAMNSRCVPVAGSEIGSVPYLIKNNENGLIFKDQDWDDLCKKVEMLIIDSELIKKLSNAAYQTILNEWNPEIAAKRFCKLAINILNKQATPFSDGICSQAEILKDGWFK